jgi:hypothetical protein
MPDASDIPQKRTKQPRKSINKVDKSRALELKINNKLTYQEIAALQGVSKQAIHQALQPLLPDDTLIKQYADHTNDIIKYGQFKAMCAYLSLDPAEQKDMIRKRGLVDFGILYDKSRLQEGLSTNNISLHADIAALQSREPEEAPGTGGTGRSSEGE